MSTVTDTTTTTDQRTKLTASGVTVLTIEGDVMGKHGIVVNTGLAISVDEGFVEVIITGLGDGDTVPITSNDPAVLRHWRELLLTMVAARAAEAQRRRPSLGNQAAHHATTPPDPPTAA